MDLRELKTILKSYSHDLYFEQNKKNPQLLYYRLIKFKQDENKEEDEICSICLENTMKLKEELIEL